MSSDPSGSSSMLSDRTGHACAQCRRRKQKCGGFTHGIKCRPCTSRNVRCSFDEEVNDVRYNPYLRLRSSKSPSVTVEESYPGVGLLSSASITVVPALPAHAANGQPLLSAVPAGAAKVTLADEELLKQVELLRARVTDLEKRPALAAPRDNADYAGTPRSRIGRPFMLPSEPDSSHRDYRSPPISIQRSFPSSDAHSLTNTPQSTAVIDGPLKTLNNLHRWDPVEFEFEVHDPIARSIVTEGEAYAIFRLYFSSCHPNAPFLDVSFDSDLDRVRSSSIVLFLAILCVGARFWSASSRTSCWLHPRYHELVRLLDAEVMRITLRPNSGDQQLETIQALMLCAHWMPFDISANKSRTRSRFSEDGAWQWLGLAIRWATSLTMERSCHLSFQQPETVTLIDVRRFRTMLYLTENDHYLALSSRRPSYLDPVPLNNVLDIFLGCPHVQATDMRLASLFRVAYSAHFTNCRPTTIASVEAFDTDVRLIEERFASSSGGRSMGALSQHFLFTSLQWYRLSYTCAFLDVTDPAQRTGKALTWAIEWASQILEHLSRPSLRSSSSKGPNNMYTTISAQLEPDPGVVDLISFAFDHYFVVIAYAAFFLVNSWLSNFVDLNLRPRVLQTSNEALDGDTSSSLLFRLVDLATRTLDMAGPPEGHFARRYVPLLRGMAGIILSDNMQTVQHTSSSTSAVVGDTINLPTQLQGNKELELWGIWQQAGLDVFWPSLFEDSYEG